MHIHLHNYEAYFQDYLSGDLNTEEVHALKKFLEAHPDKAEELQDLELFMLDISEEKEDFPALKKAFIPLGAITENNYETRLAAYIEGDLLPGEEQEMEKFLELNPDIKWEYTTMQQCKVQREALVCPDKNKLKKKTIAWRPVFYIPAAAASVAILLVLLFTVDVKPGKASGRFSARLDSQWKGWKYPVFSLPEKSVIPETNIPVVKEQQVSRIPQMANTVRKEENPATNTVTMVKEIQEETPFLIHETIPVDAPLVENKIPEEKTDKPVYTFLSGESPREDKVLVAAKVLGADVSVKETDENANLKRKKLNINSPLGELTFVF